MSVDTIDPSHAGQFAEFYDLYRRSYVRDFDQPYSAIEKKINLETDEYKLAVVLIAHDAEGRGVGGAIATLPTRDNQTVAFADVFVVPERRRQGHGTALVEKLSQLCADRGRTTLWGEACWAMDDDEAPARAFAEARGFSLDLMDAHRELLLPAQMPPLVVGDGYEVRGWRGPCPDEWVEEYAALRMLMIQESPSGDVGLENEFFDSARVRREEEQWTSAGRVPQVSVALTSDGTLVGHTQLLFPADSDEVYQWDTLVLPDHRGHGLGLALKVATMHEAADLLDGRRRIHTYNAAVNEHMIRVNEEMGFRQVAWVGEYIRSIG